MRITEKKSFKYPAILFMAVLAAVAMATSSDTNQEGVNTESIEKQVLLIGTTADISKSAKNIGLAIKNTLTKAFQEVNKKGGIRGITFQYIFLDDEYNPEIARQNFLKLTDELHVDILLAPFGTVTLSESLDLAKDDKIAAFFPAVTESTVFRNADLKNFISLTASYYEQEKALIKYVFEKRRPNKLAIFYQDDAFGKDGLHGAKDALKKLNFTDLVELPYDRNRADLTRQIKTIQEVRPDATGIFSVPIIAKEFLRKLGAGFLSKQILFGVSDLRDDDLQKYIKERGLSFIYANSLPDWQDSSMELAQEYKKFCEANGVEPDPFSFEVYVIVQIFFYLIEHIEGRVTKEKLMQEAEKIKNLDFKGLKLNFDPETRALIDSIWIAENNGKPWEKVNIKDDLIEKDASSND